jgi:hypothetical protein
MDSQPTRVALLSFSPIQQDARLLRQAIYLSREYDVTVIGYGELGLAIENARMESIQPRSRIALRLLKITFLPAGKLLHGPVYEALYWREAEHQAALELLLQSHPQLIHANDWEALPVAVKAAEKTGAKILLDLHEYGPLLRENRAYWRTFYSPMVDYFLRQYTSRISTSVTVNETIAEKYEVVYGFHPAVVMNAPVLADLPGFTPTNPDRIRLIHHGAAIRDRGLEIMIETLSHCDLRYTLHFMLVERDPRYVASLRKLAKRMAPNRVFFHSAVSPVEIVNHIATYDVGFYVLPPVNFNYQAALPNKFFDFIAAGLAVCVGPNPEMAKLVNQYGFGIVTSSFEALQAAQVLNQLGATEIDAMKRAASQARNSLNADVEMGKLLDLYHRVLS